MYVITVIVGGCILILEYTFVFLFFKKVWRSLSFETRRYKINLVIFVKFLKRMPFNYYETYYYQ